MMSVGSDRGPSLRDVALRAGVSHQTVSRVINGSPSLRPQTRDRVLAAIEELDYRPSALGRALARGRSRRIGLLIESSSEYGPMGTLRGVEVAARAAGYSTTSYTASSDDSGAFREGAEFLAGQGVDGIAIIAPRLQSLNALPELNLPRAVVLLGGLLGPQGAPDVSVGLSRVGVDQVLGTRLAMDHLLGLGHRVIGHLAGPHDWLDARARNQAWRSAMTEAGLALPAIAEGDWRAESGYQATDALLAIPGLTAVFAANDQMALGLIHGLADRGLRIPEDISVVGFDNIADSGHFRPPLTTVNQDFEALGRAGVATILRQLGEDVEETAAVVVPHLVVRESTCAAAL
jgi:DNA-binding LacI/PurR family transcriptional regulator